MVMAQVIIIIQEQIKAFNNLKAFICLRGRISLNELIMTHPNWSTLYMVP